MLFLFGKIIVSVKYVSSYLAFTRLQRNVLRNLRQRPAKEWRFFKSPLDVYMVRYEQGLHGESPESCVT